MNKALLKIIVIALPAWYIGVSGCAKYWRERLLKQENEILKQENEKLETVISEPTKVKVKVKVEMQRKQNNRKVREYESGLSKQLNEHRGL